MHAFADTRAAPRRLPVQLVLFGFVYFACARAGLAFGDEAGVTPIWPASGLLLGVLLVAPRRRWPAFAAVAFAADLGANLAAGIGIAGPGVALGDTVEALLAAAVIGLIAPGPFSLSRIRCVVALAGAAVGATAVASLIGTASVTLAFGGDFGHTWLLWWSADAIGVIAVTPAVCSLLTYRPDRIVRRHATEALVVLACLGVASALMFSAEAADSAALWPPVLVMPLLLWLAWRSGPPAAAAGSLLLAAIAALNTAHGQGPFAAVEGGQVQDLFSLQLFLGVMIGTALAIAAAVDGGRDAERALTAAERRFRTLVEQVPTVTYICDWDENATPLYMSPQFETLTGHSIERWLSEPEYWKEIVHPDDREWVVEAIARAVREEVPFAGEYRMVTADGETITILDRETIVRDENGRPVMSQGVLVDVTEQRRAERALAESEELHRSVVEALEEGVFVLDADGVVVACNTSAAAALGREPAELIGRRPPFGQLRLADGTPLDEGNSPAMRALRTGESARDVELQVIREDGEERWLSMNYLPLRSDEDGRPRGLVTSFSDVTARRQSEERIAYLAYNDALTGLPNRAALERAIGPALAHARRQGRAAALIYFDLDHFKIVNDSLGHAAGDELLRRVAERLRARVREEDMLVRLGGDEFMLLLPDLALSAVSDVSWKVAHDFIEQLEEPFEIGGSEFEISASAGIAVYPRHGERAAELLKHADAALYETKRRTRGAVAFYEDPGADPTRRLTLSSEVRRALRDDEFELQYQPVYALDPVEPIGVEALIRWRHPRRGVVPPGEFIEMAEETGLIELIGDWVLDSVLAQGERWLDLGLQPMLGFNVSPRQLRRRDFAGAVTRRVAASRVEPWQLSVEITESATAGAPERSEAVLEELHEFGLHLAIDDFGADFSSLDRLRSLPVDMLKIDRSFLVGVPEAPDATAVIKAIIQLAAALEMKAVAEGIETQDQLEFLVEQGCPLGQGFHLGRPLDVDETTALLLRSTLGRRPGGNGNGARRGTRVSQNVR
jgi:diguanylate cyclase (GGDEF)-like protein/PAS domain S-box-containing protein